ncbi:hypothetical protein PIB30_073099 [Stylosanthes scabra]|uniref:Uncharacterized protein n=1 Tax=Stylosanthes scabra TaxID=79078 RepID=A0ABU6QQF6_9FABA|nr:hypothetical protein [Stylosanthes scabra]
MKKQRKKKKIDNRRNLSQVTNSLSSSKASQIHTQVTFRLGACQVPNVTHPCTKEARQSSLKPQACHVWLMSKAWPNVAHVQSMAKRDPRPHQRSKHQAPKTTHESRLSQVSHLAQMKNEERKLEDQETKKLEHSGRKPHA